jgi:hypothetical protein
MGELRLIRTLFWLLASTVTAAAALCTFLPITTWFASRAARSRRSPRTVYRAPYDVQVESTFVTEGPPSAKGQVLVLLANTTVTSELAQATAERDALRDEARSSSGRRPTPPSESRRSSASWTLPGSASR